MSLLQKVATAGAFEEWDEHGKPLLARVPRPDEQTRRLEPDTELASMMTETLLLHGHHFSVVQVDHQHTQGSETRWQPTYRRHDQNTPWEVCSVSARQMLCDLLAVTPHTETDGSAAEAVEFLYALQGPPVLEASPSSYVRLRVGGDVVVDTVWLMTSTVREADTTFEVRLAAVEPCQ